MNQTVHATPSQPAVQIGILLAGVQGLNVTALKYLLLQMNTLQRTFEYELLPIDPQDQFLQQFASHTPLTDIEIQMKFDEFMDNYTRYLKQEIQGYDIRDTTLPQHFILITLARFDDKFYSKSIGNLSILALGYWERWMAPPSIIESIITLILMQSIAIVCPALNGSAHLGTKGCVCDFTAYLSEARFKVLNGFICQYCRTQLETQGLPGLAEELTPLLTRDWLGTSDQPKAPADIMAKLGYNLFFTKGLKPTFWENVQDFFRQDFFKGFLNMLIAILQAILIAYLLIRFGLNGH